MDRERYEIGLKTRKEVLGEEYVARAFENADDFSREFQELMTENCWGATWGRGILSKKYRSVLNLGMLAALGRSQEFELSHLR